MQLACGYLLILLGLLILLLLLLLLIAAKDLVVGAAPWLLDATPPFNLTYRQTASGTRSQLIQLDFCHRRHRCRGGR